MPWVRRILFAFFCAVALGALTMFLMGFRANAGRNSLAIEINRPAAQVFPWLIEPDKLKQWVTGLAEMKQLTPGPIQVGTKARDTIVEGNQKATADLTFTSFEQNRMIGVHLETDAFSNDVRYELAEHDGKTRLTSTSVAKYKIWLAKLMEPVITPSVQQSLQDDMGKLKKLVEAQ